MHNISPTSPVLGDPLQLFPAQPRFEWCLSQGHAAWCFLVSPPPPPFACPGSSMSRPSLKNCYVYLSLACPFPCPCCWLCPSTVFLVFSASTNLQKSGSFSAWPCSFAKFLLRIAIQTWHLCWTNRFSLFCRLPWTSTYFSKCGMLPLLCWFLLYVSLCHSSCELHYTT